MKSKPIERRYPDRINRPMFKDASILTISKINQLQANECMHKFANKLLPPILYNHFILSSLLIPTVQISIKYFGPRTWNSTPIEIRVSPSRPIKMFKT